MLYLDAHWNYGPRTWFEARYCRDFILLTPRHLGLGFASEDAKAVTRYVTTTPRLYGFGTTGTKVKEIEATVRPDNPASERLLEKCGI